MLTTTNITQSALCQARKPAKALADKTRLRIIEAVSATRHMSCGEIVSMRGVTPATVSHHLKILSEARLISCRREGQFVYSQAVPATNRSLHACAGENRARQESRTPSLTCVVTAPPSKQSL